MTIQLSQVIAQVETGGNPYLVRFEPEYSPNQLHIAKMHALAGCSWQTARVLCAMSWGMFQFMGTTLLDFGLNCPPVEFAQKTDMQIIFFESFCHSRGIFYSVDQLATDEKARLHFGAEYNGPKGAQAYAAKISKAIQTLQGGAK